jgi:hypothetical protein
MTGCRAIALACLLAALAAQSAPLAAACKVVDPEVSQTYDGQCSRNFANGKGVATGTARYDGEFRNGMKHGHGVKTWPSGDRYEGQFHDDKKQGFGIYTWGPGTAWAGERYEGQFVADQRQGSGTYTWPNGDRYEGVWDKDQRLGYSVMEIRRQQAKAAREQAFKSGVLVCRVGGAAGASATKGAVESFDGSVLKIRLVEAGGGNGIRRRRRFPMNPTTGRRACKARPRACLQSGLRWAQILLWRRVWATG